MALYERVVKRAAINRERAHPGLTLEPSSLPAALLLLAAAPRWPFFDDLSDGLFDCLSDHPSDPASDRLSDL